MPQDTIEARIFSGPLLFYADQAHLILQEQRSYPLTGWEEFLSIERLHYCQPIKYFLYFPMNNIVQANQDTRDKAIA